MNNIWKVCVCGLIRCGDQILIIKRNPKENDYAGFWEFPSGNLEFEEEIEGGLRREISEEIGKTFEKEEIILIGSSKYKIEKKDEMRFVIQLNYLIEVEEKFTPKLSSEHIDYDWVNNDDSRIDSFLLEIINQIVKRECDLPNAQQL
ncbi:MAG: NUDIX domain-containing protein [Nanoarchaeota archaeon]